MRSQLFRLYLVQRSAVCAPAASLRATAGTGVLRVVPQSGRMALPLAKDANWEGIRERLRGVELRVGHDAREDAREQHARAVREELTPERRALLLKMKKTLDVLKAISADGQTLDDYANLETDGHGFPPGAWWAQHLTVDDCLLERWTRELQRDGWLP